MSADSRYPLGPPVNRPGPPVAVPIPGRPHWFEGANGRPPFYVEPKKDKP